MGNGTNRTESRNRKQYPNADDFKNITTLRDKYVINWEYIPQQLQEFILQCDSYYMMNTQEIVLYKDKKIVASIGTSRYYSDTEINSIGAGELFQWNIRDGFTLNNL